MQKFYANQNTDTYIMDLQNKISCVDEICTNNRIPVMHGSAFDIDFALQKSKHWFPKSLHSLIRNTTDCGHAQIQDHPYIKDQIKNFIIDSKLI